MPPGQAREVPGADGNVINLSGRHCRDSPVAAAAGPRRGHSRHPVRLPSGCRRTCLPDGRLAGADGARVVASRPRRPVPARKGTPLMVPLARHGRAPALPPACPPRHPRRAWAPPGGRRARGRGAHPPPSRRHPSGQSASRASRRPLLRSRRTAPSCDASVPAPRGTRNTGSRATGHPCPWFPPLSDGTAAFPRPRDRAGAAITEGRWGWNHRWHHWHSQWLAHQSKA